MIENGRECYRIVYPLAERPVFHGPGVVAMVSDVSETGMTLVAPVGQHAKVRPGDRITGTIQFRHVEAPAVDGVVLRLTAHGFVVHFDAVGVPWPVILTEERAILARHPH